MRETPPVPSVAWRGLALAAGLVVLGDAVQPLVLDWKPKLVGALAGAVLYTALAVGAWQRRRSAALVAVAMPLLPSSLLALHAAGVSVPVEPDGAMVAVLAAQLTAAAFGAAALRTPG